MKVSTFRERFYELISSGDKSMKEFSKDLHVSNQTISAWKTGARSPKEPTIIAIANHFGVSVQWLMGFDVPKREYHPKLDLGMFNDERANKFPRSNEARIISFAVDSMPPEDREKALKMFTAVYSDYIQKAEDKIG